MVSRLPIPGGDSENWGNILNDFLSQAHQPDGLLKTGSVGASQLQGSSITVAKLDAGVQSTLTSVATKSPSASPTFTGTVTVPAPANSTDAATKAYVDAAAMSGVPDATTTGKGAVQLAGDLGGTAASPTVPGLAGKEPTITATTSTDYYRGDKTFQPLDKTAVGLGSVDNTSDATKNSAAVTLTNKTLTGPVIAKLSNLTANGVMTTSAGDGTLGISIIPLDSTKYLDGFGNFTAPSVPIGMISGGGQLFIGSEIFSDPTTGFDELGLGHGAVSSAHQTTAFGNYSQTTGTESAAFGIGAAAFGHKSLALGSFTTAGVDGALVNEPGSEALAVGSAASSTGMYSAAVGSNAIAEGEQSLAIGGNATASSIGSVSVGSANVEAGADYSIALGYATEVPAAHNHSVAIGSYTITTASDQFAVGPSSIEPGMSGQFSTQPSVVLRSPNGTRWSITVDDAGTLVVTPA